MPRTRFALPLACVLASLFVPAYSAADESMPAWAYTRDARPLHDRAEHLARLGIADWHAAGFRGRGVTVAVLDSGFRGYKDSLGKSLPAAVGAKSFRRDGNLEAKDSQHGILCGEVVHALAPDAGLLFANWEPDDPDSFLAAVRWARNQGARVVTCSVIMPAWSDGEGNGPVHRRLREIVGDGTGKGDVLFVSCAGNVARRHWAGTFRPGPDGCHRWADGVSANELRPWGSDRVSLDLCWSDPAARYAVEVIDAEIGKAVEGCSARVQAEPPAVRVRFTPKAGRAYAVRVRQEAGSPGKFHLTALGADLGVPTARGSIPFPGDGPEVLTVGAVGADGRREGFSACGPNSATPKPDLVAPVPFGSFQRPRPFGGTSAAAPQAAAVAAVFWSRQAGVSAAKVRAALTGAARDLAEPGHDPETGYGAVRLPAVAAR